MSHTVILNLPSARLGHRMPRVEGRNLFRIWVELVLQTAFSVICLAGSTRSMHVRHFRGFQILITQGLSSPNLGIISVGFLNSDALLPPDPSKWHRQGTYRPCVPSRPKDRGVLVLVAPPLLTVPLLTAPITTSSS